MVENVGRKILLISILMIGSILALVIPMLRGKQPFPLGLDIAGGTRWVYSFDFEQARQSGAIDASANQAQVLQDTIKVIRERLDNAKQTEATIRAAGTDRIEVQVPATAQAATGLHASAPLAVALDAETATLVALGGEPAKLSDFPGGGGVVAIGNEHIRFRQRNGNQLTRVERGYDDTAKSAHAAGENVVLISDDLIKNAIENLGELHFYANALDEDFRKAASDATAAKQKLDAWLAKPENANASVATYNLVPADQGGPPSGILWFPRRPEAGTVPPPLAQRPFVAVAVQQPQFSFDGGDLSKVFISQDDKGLPAVGFELSAERRVDFTEFTRQHIDKQMAIVLDNEIVTDPRIESTLPGRGIINGGSRGFTQREVSELVTVLKSGSLAIKPTLEQEEKVGASIGDDYVRRNVIAGLLTLGLISAFMMLYYRGLGVGAVICLICNLTMLFGAMVLTQSTLTLAGIGGIVLTIGMAVDANILIFDRIREEQERGRKPLQAAKEGFAGANAAIIDGNLTTLITGIILQVIGTGTIKGFAVTLNAGILSSMFAALVIGRVAVHVQLKMGIEKWHIGRWLADAKFKFIDKAKVMVTISALIIVVGCVGFALLDDTKKLGIDFLGGASVKVRTENPMNVDEVRTRVGQLPGELANAEVVDLPGSRDASGKAREFRITFKTDPNNTETAGLERSFTREVRTGLADILQADAIVVDVRTEGTEPLATGTLHFEKEHPAEDVKTVLTTAGLTNPDATYHGDRHDVFDIKGTPAVGSDNNTVLAAINAAFTGKSDSSGRTYQLVGPLGQSMVIGAQVVGDLRDSAIKALVLSAVLMLLYIRVRFAEYSYGFGALLADLHDLFSTLAAIAFLIWIPWIHVEMNLTMIAAFLTILGYSINDTIIVYDRIRENRPRVKGTLREVIDLSVNQTLSRTILTSSTVIVAALIMLAFNFGTGNPLEGFAFALAWGVITGTFSSIYIASPLMMWIEERAERKAKGGDKAGKTSNKPATQTSQGATP